VNYRYWDACAFIGWLKEEPDKTEECKSVIWRAEAGKVTIVTSAFTLVEVLRLKGKDPIPQGDQEKVRKFFENGYIAIYNVDRTVAEMAQDVVWNHGVLPKDAVHVATALSAGRGVLIDQLDTFDGPLIARSGQIGQPPLVIGRPAFPEELVPNVAG
jgi:hypothetical protein